MLPCPAGVGVRKHLHRTQSRKQGSASPALQGPSLSYQWPGKWLLDPVCAHVCALSSGRGELTRTPGCGPGRGWRAVGLPQGGHQKPLGSSAPPELWDLGASSGSPSLSPSLHPTNGTIDAQHQSHPVPSAFLPFPVHLLLPGGLSREPRSAIPEPRAGHCPDGRKGTSRPPWAWRQAGFYCLGPTCRGQP